GEPLLTKFIHEDDRVRIAECLTDTAYRAGWIKSVCPRFPDRAGLNPQAYSQRATDEAHFLITSTAR
ncbi:MAG: hypothetical protein VW757_11415, partial [Halieaceae bacterium]